jgi:hypothetical protein
MVKRTRSKRGGQLNPEYQVNQPNQPNQVNQPNQPNQPNWVNNGLETISNSASKISDSASNLFNSITAPKPGSVTVTGTGINGSPYDPNVVKEEPKPWWKIWGGRRRTKSKKNRRSRKKRSYRRRK